MSWLQQCLKTHHICSQTVSQARLDRILPTRLLDVSFSEDATRIVTAFEGGVYIEYATLSHCCKL
jgi:hypothetical protein